MKRSLLSCATGFALVGAMTTPGLANDRSEFVTVEDDVLTYAPAFFTDFNPQTALDMVDRVPGFSVSGGGGSRGLAGSLGNVLIDGRRPSSKNGVDTLLSRLPAASITEIQLIRAPIPGIDMAGQEQVVNVITSQSGRWTGAWEARARIFENERIVPAVKFPRHGPPPMALSHSRSTWPGTPKVIMLSGSSSSPTRHFSDQRPSAISAAFMT